MGVRGPEREQRWGSEAQRRGRGLGRAGLRRETPRPTARRSLACLPPAPRPPAQAHWKPLRLAPPARLTPHTAGSLAEHTRGTAQEGTVASVLLKMVKLRPRVPPNPHPQAAPTSCPSAAADSAEATVLTLAVAAPQIKGVSEPGSHTAPKGRHPQAAVAVVTTIFHSSGSCTPSPKDGVTMFWHLAAALDARAGLRPPC